MHFVAGWKTDSGNIGPKERSVEPHESPWMAPFQSFGSHWRIIPWLVTKAWKQNTSLKTHLCAMEGFADALMEHKISRNLCEDAQWALLCIMKAVTHTEYCAAVWQSMYRELLKHGRAVHLGHVSKMLVTSTNFSLKKLRLDSLTVWWWRSRSSHQRDEKLQKHEAKFRNLAFQPCSPTLKSVFPGASDDSFCPGCSAFKGHIFRIFFFRTAFFFLEFIHQKWWMLLLLYTLPKTNSSPLKMGHPNKKGSSSHHPFSGARVNDVQFTPPWLRSVGGEILSSILCSGPNPCLSTRIS